MAAPQFVHLHTHSHFSLLNALPKVPELVEAAAADEQPALALTDAGNLYGAIEFYKLAQKKGVKPIIGIDAYVAARTRFDKEPRIDSRHSRVVLLAKDHTGYTNLLKLASAGFLEGFYYKPRIDRELLEKHREGIIAILPSFASEVSRALSDGNHERAHEAARWYQSHFGPDDLFMEITRHDIAGHADLEKEIMNVAEEHSIPLVAAHDVYYLKPEDKTARETLLKIQSSGTVSADMSEDTADFSFISSRQAEKLFSDIPQALRNTIEIAERCNLDLTLGSWVFPNLELSDDTTYDEELRKRTYAGIAERGMEKTKEVTDRIEYELDVIQRKGFSPYFLVVADLLDFARKNRILSTTRGSAAGSLVSYLNFITNVDPLEYKLPFERFLNPERPKAPDIDMDFADDRRDEVIAYAREKYGEDRVAQIGTFGTMMARGVVRDVARALGYPYATGDQIAKQIPFGSQGFPMTINKAFESVKDFADLYKSDEDIRTIVDLSKKIEGSARHISIHAAGVVIAPGPVTEYTPIQFDPKGSGKYVTQYNMHAVEDAGLLKFDFLGIRNLSILADSVERVREAHGVDIDVEKIPLDDPRTFNMLAEGETMGVFQLSSAGMTKYLMDLKPTTIHDINAMIALYRPGPMEVIPEYIRRKHDPSLVSYPDPRMESFLKESYGLIVYQDDLLFSALELAGYSWLEADNFRKAVGKKIPEEMAAQKEKFTSGIVENGQTQEFAEYLWKLFEPFQAYGFNKAHAASYGKVAYQTAYMKANYPVEYMAALLSAEAGDIDKISEAVTECDRMNTAVLPPDVNESFGDFTVVKDANGNPAIRFGLHSIKNVGTAVADNIIAEREKNGAFTDIADLFGRITDSGVNRKQLEALIMCGALDSFGERGTLLANIEKFLSYMREAGKQPSSQDSLFAAGPADLAPTLHIEEAEQIGKRQRLSWEKEHLGLYVSGHPLDEHREKLNNMKQDIRGTKQNMYGGVQTVIAGMIESAKPILTKKGDRMLFCTIRDLSDSVEAVVFPSVYQKHAETLVPEACVALQGRLSRKNGGDQDAGDEMNFIVDAVKTL